MDQQFKGRVFPYRDHIPLTQPQPSPTGCPLVHCPPRMVQQLPSDGGGSAITALRASLTKTETARAGEVKNSLLAMR